MNMTTAEFLKAMEDGEVGAKKFLPGFTDLLRQKAAPGLEKAFESIRVASGKMRSEYNLMIKALTEAGIGDVLVATFDTLRNLITIITPILSLLVGIIAGFLKGITFLFGTIIEAVADLVSWLDKASLERWGMGLSEIAGNIGEIVGYIASMFAGGIFGYLGKVLGYFEKWIDSLKLIWSLISKIPGIKLASGERGRKLANLSGRAYVSSSLAEGAYNRATEERSNSSGGSLEVGLNAGPGIKDYVSYKINERTDNVNVNTR